MVHDDIADPRVVPRWVEAGVSGVPRPAEWDAVFPVELPELTRVPDAEIRFRRLAGDAVEADSPVGQAILGRLGEVVEEQVAAPYEAVAVRRGSDQWTIAVRRARLEQVDLPDGLEAAEITVARAPDGARSVVVDGEELEQVDGPLARAVEALEAQGRRRHEAFVARAVLGRGRWNLTVDPL